MKCPHCLTDFHPERETWAWSLNVDGFHAAISVSQSISGLRCPRHLHPTIGSRRGFPDQPEASAALSRRCLQHLLVEKGEELGGKSLRPAVGTRATATRKFSCGSPIIGAGSVGVSTAATACFSARLRASSPCRETFSGVGRGQQPPGRRRGGCERRRRSRRSRGSRRTRFVLGNRGGRRRVSPESETRGRVRAPRL